MMHNRRGPTRRRLAGVFIAVGLLAAACGSTTTENADVGVTPSADGGQIDFGSLEGTDAVLWFWAPW